MEVCKVHKSGKVSSTQWKVVKVDGRWKVDRGSGTNERWQVGVLKFMALGSVSQVFIGQSRVMAGSGKQTYLPVGSTPWAEWL
ncbi:uncharacterized protein N7525_008182 [Penicillium rubens]|uniref:uncharacterized protein n=1 Tax=Penicillium rubens TaxID=1108849 RepID=UPI002A5A7DD5|nr:uncharacterized protein N7525_008182 [Penicillium rubens]KAJ5829929.1 hypothetical protein N7525_008182 [Penicillium rubens]KAJ5853515.1 hypothetical protein N7534_006058 [Penicillium rubens]